MSEKTGIDVVLVPEETAIPLRVTSLLLHRIELPPEAVAAIMGAGIVPIRVQNMDDVQLVSVPVVHVLDAPQLEPMAQAAIEICATHSNTSSISTRSAFGDKILKMLLPQKAKR